MTRNANKEGGVKEDAVYVHGSSLEMTVQVQ